MSTNKDWVPVRRGAVYCSPNCGGGCTWKAYQDAVRKANKLVKMLKGEGWKPRVWENCGWHFMAHSGTVQVYDGRFMNGPQVYHCMISDHSDFPGLMGGSSLWTSRSAFLHKDPNKVVARAFKQACEATKEILHSLYLASVASGLSKDAILKKWEKWFKNSFPVKVRHVKTTRKTSSSR